MKSVTINYFNSNEENCIWSRQRCMEKREVRRRGGEMELTSVP